MHTTDAGAPRGQSRSGRNDHVIHNGDNHNDDDHSNNDQYNLVRGAGHLPSPLKKMRKTSHQRQIDHQNKRKAKEAYAQALARATMLIDAERGKEKENACLMLSIIMKVEGEFRARGFEVSLSKATVNRYVRNDMLGSEPLARGYEEIIPKAAFKLLVLAIELFMQIKQLNCKVIVRKQLLVVVNKMCGIASVDRIKENMLHQQHHHSSLPRHGRYAGKARHLEGGQRTRPQLHESSRLLQIPRPIPLPRPLGARGGYLPCSSRKHDDHDALPPCPKSCQNMTRTWDTSAKKNISVHLWLVRVDSTQRMIKKHIFP